MNRWLSVVGSVLVTFPVATLSFAVDPLPRPGPTPPLQVRLQEARNLLSREAAQKLRTMVPRATVVNALMSGPATKSALTAEAAKRGISSAQLANMASTPISRVTTKPLSMMTPEQAADAALLKLNWNAGLTFTPFDVPRYGSGSWRVGCLGVLDAHIATDMDEQYVVMHLSGGGASDYGLIVLELELPLNQLAFYAITVRLGNFNPAWLGGGFKADFSQFQNNQWSSHSNIPFTVLPDRSGCVGVFSVNPTEYQKEQYEWRQMRRMTTYISIDLHALGSVWFRGVTITRL